MKRNYNFSSTLTISEVSSPGTCLNYDNDIYVSVSVMGQYKETRLLPADLPAFFNDQFYVSRTFYMEYSADSVIDKLYDEPVYIKLIEVSNRTGLNTVLASYTTNARDFLFPYPSCLPYYSSFGREYLMVRTIDFPDYISPRLRFSTSSKVVQTYPYSYEEPVSFPLRERYYEPYLGRSRSATRRSRSRTRPCPSYERPTYSSINRSVSPRRFRSQSKSRSKSPACKRNVSSDEGVGGVRTNFESNFYTKVPNYKIDSLKDSLERLERDLRRARMALN
uniref:Spermatogenesis-associated protein 6 N-terminal domain-containing protein n=1 Tax=Dicyema japonicum TaxID=399803 RepID=B9ZYY1_DICJA|nr:hypothetical protein [Dicyema japonicum]